MNNRVLRLR